MLSALLTRYKTPRDKHFSEVTEVTQVQASNGKALARYPTKSAGVTEVTPRADVLLPVTPVTPCYPTRVTAKALSIQGCTPVTSVTPQKQQHPQKAERPEGRLFDFPGAALILEWLESIGEADPASIVETLDRCANDPDALAYFTQRAAADNLQKNEGNAAFDDDRRTCGQCANLIARRCQAAKRGEIVASRNYEPIRDLPRRCEAFREVAA